MWARSVLVLALATGCSVVLGIEDPSTGGGGDDDSGPRTLVSIKITPDPLELPLGVQLQLTATGKYSDNSIDDLTSRVMWTRDSGSSISLSAAGLVKAMMPGPSTISAAF